MARFSQDNYEKWYQETKARESGQTLVGFLRGRSTKVYAGTERITR